MSLLLVPIGMTLFVMLTNNLTIFVFFYLFCYSKTEVAEALAYERKRGEKSKYAPYIDVLPTLDDDNLLALPRFWKDGRLDKVTDGGQLMARMLRDERKDIGE